MNHPNGKGPWDDCIPICITGLLFWSLKRRFAVVADVVVAVLSQVSAENLDISTLTISNGTMRFF